MALLSCKECGKDVSTKAKSCPHCGAPPPKEAPKETSGVSFKSIFLIIVVFLIIAFALDPPPKKLKESKPAYTKWQVAPADTNPLASEKRSTPEIDDFIKSMAIDQIKESNGVRYAAISQTNEKVNLAITVDYRVSKKDAKRLGDNFMRLVKTYSKDEPPSKDLGSGIYNYVVGVYYPNCIFRMISATHSD